MSEPLERISSCINELTSPYLHAERYHLWSGPNRVEKMHITRQPSLLDQLRQLIDPAHTTGEDGDPITRSAFGSRPAANLHALDLLAAIESRALDYAAHAALIPRHTLEATLLALVGHAAAADTDFVTALAREVSTWHRRVRITCGLQPPLYAPDALCPTCEAPPVPGSGLRVRDDGDAAWCLTCGTAWDHTTITALKDHLAATGAPQ